LLEILDTPREETTCAMVAEAAQLMADAGAMDGARAAAEKLRRTALDQIRDLEPPALSRALATVMEYLAGRES
jgi:geranylgeranyl pyrophosphate synthase